MTRRPGRPFPGTGGRSARRPATGPVAGGSEPTVLYVGGYGRSGSSALDMLLDASDGVFGAGELVTLFGAVEDGRRCSCGAPYPDCPVWGRVLADVLGDHGLTAAEAAAITRRTEHGFRPDDRYGPLWRSVFERAAEVTGSPTIVDSSKTTRYGEWRPTRLAQAGLTIRFVHLVRSPAAVLDAATRGRNRDLAVGVVRPRGPFVPALSWLYSNALADLQARSSLPRPGVVITYEDLVDDPERALDVLARTFRLDLSGSRSLAAEGRELPVGHGVSGNRMRVAGGGVLTRGAPQPPVPHRTSVRVLGSLLGQLARRAGWLGGGPSART